MAAMKSIKHNHIQTMNFLPQPLPSIHPHVPGAPRAHISSIIHGMDNDRRHHYHHKKQHHPLSYHTNLHSTKQDRVVVKKTIRKQKNNVKSSQDEKHAFVPKIRKTLAKQKKHKKKHRQNSKHAKKTSSKSKMKRHYKKRKHFYAKGRMRIG